VRIIIWTKCHDSVYACSGGTWAVSYSVKPSAAYRLRQLRPRCRYCKPTGTHPIYRTLLRRDSQGSRVVNTDISLTVIRQMRERYPLGVWIVSDATTMSPPGKERERICTRSRVCLCLSVFSHFTYGRGYFNGG
jgi:hypothetical protein